MKSPLDFIKFKMTSYECSKLMRKYINFYSHINKLNIYIMYFNVLFNFLVACTLLFSFSFRLYLYIDAYATKGKIVLKTNFNLQTESNYY